VATYDAITGRTETGTGTGTLIPDAERREILQELPSSSTVLSLGRRVNMSTKVERQPVLSALPQAYWVSGDTGLKETTKQEWDSKVLTAEELAVIVPVPEAVLSDSNYDLFGEIRPRLVEAIGSKLDEAVLFGNEKPASFEAGIVPAAIAAKNSVGHGTVDYADDVNSLMAKVEADDYSVNGFAARNRVKAKLRGLRDANRGVLFQPSLTAGTPGTLYGEPIIYSDANGAWENEWIDLIAGDWSKLVIAVRQDITYKLFTEGVVSDGSGNVVLNLMQQDSVALRVVARYAFTVANPITRRHQTTTERYPFAVLEDAGS
jgi:HK97 family phage major capsid protein